MWFVWNGLTVMAFNKEGWFYERGKGPSEELKEQIKFSKLVAMGYWDTAKWTKLGVSNYGEPSHVNSSFRSPLQACGGIFLDHVTLFGSCVFCAPLDRYIGRHIDRYIGRHIGRVSVDMSTDILAESRSTLSANMSVDMSTDTRPICWPICRPRVIVRLSADMSIDRLPTFRRYFTATCPCCHRHWLAKAEWLPGSLRNHHL